MAKDGQRAAGTPAGKPASTSGAARSSPALNAVRAMVMLAALQRALRGNDDDDDRQAAEAPVRLEPVYAREAVRNEWCIERAVATAGVRILPLTKVLTAVEKNLDGTVNREHDDVNHLSSWRLPVPEDGPFDYNTKTIQEWTTGDELRVRYLFPGQPVLRVPPGDRYDFMATDCEHGSRNVNLKLLRSPEDGMNYTGVLELVDATHRVTHLSGASGPVRVPPDCPIVVLVSDIPKERRAADCPASDCVFVKPGDPTPAFAANTVYVWVTPVSQ